ncbi:MAG: sensor histidine kinase [Gemmobacter sp.]
MDPAVLHALLEGVPMPLVLIGPDARIVTTNRAAEALFGPDLAGRHYMVAIRQPLLVDPLERVLAGGAAEQARYVVTSTGKDTIYRVLVAPLDGRGASLAFEDITDIEQAADIRRDFVANVSHELRTPLTALSGFIETLKGAARDDPAARDRFLTIMERETARMNRLVGDLLSLSRVEAAERVRPTEKVDLCALARSAAATLRGLSDRAGVVIRLDLPAEPVWVPGDPDQLTQVLHNLIENGVKYGGSGGEVCVTIFREDLVPALRGPGATISVSDRGEGIDPIHLPRLTERFYRVDNHRSREHGGTGLGLAIVKHIANRHRGRLRISSEKGVGSTFAVTLPA